MARIRTERDANLALLATLSPATLTRAPGLSPYVDLRVPCGLFVVELDPMQVEKPSAWVIAPNIFAARMGAQHAWGGACISIVPHAMYDDHDARGFAESCKPWPNDLAPLYADADLVVLP